LLALLEYASGNRLAYDALRVEFDQLRIQKSAGFHGLEAVLVHLQSYAFDNRDTPEGRAVTSRLAAIEARIAHILRATSDPASVPLVVFTDADDTLYRTPVLGGSDDDAAQAAKKGELYIGVVQSYQDLQSIVGAGFVALEIVSARPDGIGYAGKLEALPRQLQAQAEAEGVAGGPPRSVRYLGAVYDPIKMASKVLTGEITKETRTRYGVEKALIRESMRRTVAVVAPTSNTEARRVAGNPLTYYAVVESKIKIIDAAIAAHPDRPIVFFGDNGQGDLWVAQYLRARYPQSIVCIHNIRHQLPGQSGLSPLFDARQVQALKATGVMVYDSHADLQSQVRTQGPDGKQSLKTRSELLREYALTHPTPAQQAVQAIEARRQSGYDPNAQATHRHLNALFEAKVDWCVGQIQSFGFEGARHNVEKSQPARAAFYYQFRGQDPNAVATELKERFRRQPLAGKQDALISNGLATRKALVPPPRQATPEVDSLDLQGAYLLAVQHAAVGDPAPSRGPPLEAARAVVSHLPKETAETVCQQFKGVVAQLEQVVAEHWATASLPRRSTLAMSAAGPSAVPSAPSLPVSSTSSVTRSVDSGRAAAVTPSPLPPSSARYSGPGWPQFPPTAAPSTASSRATSLSTGFTGSVAGGAAWAGVGWRTDVFSGGRIVAPLTPATAVPRYDGDALKTAPAVLNPQGGSRRSSGDSNGTAAGARPLLPVRNPLHYGDSTAGQRSARRPSTDSVDTTAGRPPPPPPRGITLGGGGRPRGG
jgi:hypothetical protein